MVDLQGALKQFSKDKATQTYLNELLVKQENTLVEQKNHSDDLLESRSLIMAAAEATQKNLEYHINGLVSMALAAVFEEDPYEFRLEFVQKRGKTEADVWFVRHGEKLKPIDASGGGAVDVASFALRMAFWSLTKKTRPIFFFDEPMRMVSSNLLQKAAKMIKLVSEKLKLQIIMITHSEELSTTAEKKYEVSIKQGKSITSACFDVLTEV